MLLLNGTVVPVFRWVTHRQTAHEIQTRVDAGLRDGIALLSACDAVGINAVYESIDDTKIRKLVAAAASDDEIHIVVNWLSGATLWKPAIMQAIGNGATVELLMLHPDSEFIAPRIEELEAGRADYDSSLFTAQQMSEASKDLRGEFRLLFYDRPTYTPLFVLGTDVYAGWYFVSSAGSQPSMTQPWIRSHGPLASSHLDAVGFFRSHAEKTHGKKGSDD